MAFPYFSFHGFEGFVYVLPVFSGVVFDVPWQAVGR